MIGFSSEQYTTSLEIHTGGTVLADSWILDVLGKSESKGDCVSSYGQDQSAILDPRIALSDVADLRVEYWKGRIRDRVDHQFQQYQR